jgi:hypothetical protein
MLSTSLTYQNLGIRPASSRLLKHFNAGTLALVMIIALALLSAIRDSESATKQSAPVENTTRGCQKPADNQPDAFGLTEPQETSTFTGSII